MNYRQYTSAGEWYRDARKEGFMPNASMMHGITQTMQKLEMSFADAFEFLQATKKILLVDKLYYFNLNYEKLFDLSETERSLLVQVWEVIDHVHAKDKKLLKIYFRMSNTTVFDFMKSQIDKIYLAERIKDAEILMTYGTQYGSPIHDVQSGDFNPKYAIVLSFSLHSHVIGERGSLYVLKEGKYCRIPSVPLPTKKWAEWASKTTGKPDGEWWLQGLFLLTELEDFTYEEAQKFMQENWDS